MKIIIAALIFTLSGAVMAQNPPMQGIFTIPPKVEVTIINSTVKAPVRVIQQRPVQGWRNPAYNTNKPTAFNKGIYTVPRLRIKDLDLE